LSPELEQLLNRWHREGTPLNIEFASKHIAFFGSGMLTSFSPDQLLLDCQAGCGYRISLPDATCELRPVNPADPVRVIQDADIVGQVQISLEDNQRVLLSENRRLG